MTRIELETMNQKTKQYPFFATQLDLSEWLSAVEDERDLDYVEVGYFDMPSKYKRFKNLASSERLGVAVYGDQAREPAYLVLPVSTEIEVRRIEARGGGTRYAIDQEVNPISIFLSPGGVFHEDVIISGRIGTVSVHPESLALLRLFFEKLERRFAKIRSFYVGHDAGKWLDAGRRLATSVRSPTEYDLKR